MGFDCGVRGKEGREGSAIDAPKTDTRRDLTMEFFPTSDARDGR
jgi:hypothetical protein